MQLVQTHGPLNWVRIAQTLGSRTPKQCRERYHQNLKPTLNHEPITPEEGEQIERLVLEIGKRWAEIARRLHGRSDNAVKNWWNGSQNRRKRLDRRRTTHSLGPSDEYYPRSMSMSGQSLPLPRPNSMQSAIDHRAQWPDVPLPSPCSSESPDTESCTHYTTSPRRIPALPRQAVELPPLRAWPGSNGAEPALPSLSSLARPASNKVEGLHHPQHHTQLPTAPNSPVQHQQRSSTKDRDSRMNLSSLLA